MEEWWYRDKKTARLKRQKEKKTCKEPNDRKSGGPAFLSPPPLPQVSRKPMYYFHPRIHKKKQTVHEIKETVHIHPPIAEINSQLRVIGISGDSGKKHHRRGSQGRTIDPPGNPRHKERHREGGEGVNLISILPRRIVRLRIAHGIGHASIDHLIVS